MNIKLTSFESALNAAGMHWITLLDCRGVSVEGKKGKTTWQVITTLRVGTWEGIQSSHREKQHPNSFQSILTARQKIKTVSRSVVRT